ncbi:MAG: class I SAM-dependent methyltransferase [Candidatus Helarchaeota archaeon]
MPRIEPFEKYTSRYDRWFKRHRFAFQSELLTIRSQLDPRGIGIEIGVGSGQFAAPLGIHLGVDPSKQMLKLAKQRGIETLKSIAENLPFRNASFDYLLMVTTICFLDDIDRAFSEAYRVLKPTGSFLVGFIDKNSPLGLRYQQFKHKNLFYRIATFYSVEDVCTHLKKAGFKHFDFTQTLFSNLSEIKEVEPIMKGHGQGAFILIRVGK